MAEFKLVIGDPKSGKSYQKEVKDAEAAVFLNKKIRDAIKGDSIGLPGYEFELTGGSDNCGFPMRYDVAGPTRKKILAVSGVGLKKKGKGIRQRKTVCGNTVYVGITQINLKVTKHGKSSIDGSEEPEAAKAAEVEKPEAEAKPEAVKAAEVEKPEAEAKPSEEKKSDA